MKKRAFEFAIVGVLAIVLFLSGCVNNGVSKPLMAETGISQYDLRTGDIIVKGEEELTEQTIIIGASADIHGRIYAYDYATDTPDSDAGLAKIYTAILETRAANPNMILMDVGDTVQDNSAELFNDLDVHPMIQALNEMGYDTWTLGNHEFNFERSFLDRNILAFNGAVLSSNIKEVADGSFYVQPYKIFSVNGCRVAIVGITPPNISTWEASSPSHFKGLEFEGTLESVKATVASIEGQYDVLVGAFHMARVDEVLKDAGVYDLADNIQEFDVIVGGHEHAKYVEQRGNVAIIEPGKYGWALAKVDIQVKKDGDKWNVVSVEANNVETKKLEESPEILSSFKFVHDQSVADANVVVGTIKGEFVDGVDYITGENKVTTMPRSQIEDTPVIDFINEVQMFYTGAEISSAALFQFGSTLHDGEFKKKDVAYIYKYPNTLVGVNITGANFKKYMEWSASYYNTAVDGDLTVSFNKDIRGYNYDMFSGVTYDIDVSKPAGERVVNVMFNGAPLDDTKVFKLAVNNYRFGTLLSKGFATADDKYFDSYETMQDAGRIRSLIVQYVQEEKDGVVTSTVDNNWKIIGFDFDNPMIAAVFAKIKDGSLEIPKSDDGRTMNIRSLTKADL